MLTSYIFWQALFFLFLGETPSYALPLACVGALPFAILMIVAVEKIMPTEAGNITIDYSLNSPEFTTSVIQQYNSYQYHIFGFIIVGILFLKYSIKSLCTVPHSPDKGSIIGHILSLKCGALILYPIYIENVF